MESETILPSPPAIYTVALWLVIWMANNVFVTVLNKAAFAKVDFKYPYSLSVIHMACNIIGAQLFFCFSRTTKPKLLPLDGSSRKSVFLFSVIFALNIAIGNTSLRWASVNFNQVCRSLVPVVVMIISILYYKKTYSTSRKWAVLPIVLGVALTFYGDITATPYGIFYTALCVLLAALKVVAAGELLTGELKLHPIDLLSKMCPLALIQIGVLAFSSGEIHEIASKWRYIVTSAAPQVVLLSGVLSFSLNVSSFVANKLTSALTLCIAANIKQACCKAFHC